MYIGPPVGRAKLLAGAAVPLSLGQAHHQVNVVRIFKKRRRSRRIVVDGRDNTNNKGWVRIFNGHNREWLTRVVSAVPPPPAAAIQGRNGRRTPLRGGEAGGSGGGQTPCGQVLHLNQGSGLCVGRQEAMGAVCAAQEAAQD